MSGSNETSESTEAGLSLEARLARLDEIVRHLEGDEIGLDAALELFEEGIAHVRAAEKALAETELRVEELLGNGDDVELRPFDEGPE